MYYEKTQVRLVVRGLNILVLTSLLCFLVPSLSGIRFAETWTRDLRNFLFPVTTDEVSDVVLVYVTENALDGLECRVPLDRDFLARNLAPLASSGARVLGVDILFDSRTRHDPQLKELFGSLPFPVVHAWLGEEQGLGPQQVQALDAFIGEGRRGLATLLTGTYDGVVRALPTVASGSGVAPFAGEIAELAGAQPDLENWNLAYSPVLADGRPWIKSYPVHYLHQILRLDPGIFAGKVLMVGLKSPLRDMHRAPFTMFGADDTHIPGVEVHAHAVAQLLHGITIETSGLVLEFLIILAMVSLGWLVAFVEVRFLAQIAIALGCLAVFFVASVAAHAVLQLFLPIITPMLGMVVGFTASALLEAGQLRRQRARVRGAFSQYVPSQVVDQLIDTPWSRKLGGERKVITCLFTDIEGFTTTSERMDPADLVQVMNAYFDRVTKIIHAHEGTVDKFIGDAVVAFFGAPIDQPDHADRALAAAIEIRRFSDGMTSSASPVGATRIGVHTGEAIIGNIGGELRQNYTALGDAVNLASRLEGANKYLQSRVCVSEATHAASTRHACRYLATIRVKGRGQALEVFEPMEVYSDDAVVLEKYRQAYAGLGDSRAVERLAALRGLVPEDRVLEVHLAKLQGATLQEVVELEGK